MPHLALTNGRPRALMARRRREKLGPGAAGKLAGAGSIAPRCDEAVEVAPASHAPAGMQTSGSGGHTYTTQRMRRRFEASSADLHGAMSAAWDGAVIVTLECDGPPLIGLTMTSRAL